MRAERWGGGIAGVVGWVWWPWSSICVDPVGCRGWGSVGVRGTGGLLAGLDLGLRTAECKWELHCGVCCNIVLVGWFWFAGRQEPPATPPGSPSYTLLLSLHIPLLRAFCACRSVVDADCDLKSVECCSRQSRAAVEV